VAVEDAFYIVVLVMVDYINYKFENDATMGQEFCNILRGMLF
jgi:hypothetical protein